tara:strand:- start:1116 stop:2000 length:885 start_codon:yes stop_codon:yes gene_type:complete
MAEEYENDDKDFGDEIEVEIIDDTPEEDQGRAKLKDEDDDNEDEIESYSKGVQKRINQIQHKYHDERRAKEALERQNAEAIRIAQTILQENEQLKSTLNWGHQEYTKEATGRLDYAHKIAQDKYRRAFETGDTDGVLEAQDELTELSSQKRQLSTLVSPVPQKALQQQNNDVYIPQQPVPEAPRDYKAEDWAGKNPWFGKDEEMTAFAYGLHEKLVKSGVDPTSDEYYQRVDSRIREIFPKNFDRKKSSPVASVGRTTAPRKVALNNSEIAIAKRLGITPELYAKYKIKEQSNG